MDEQQYRKDDVRQEPEEVEIDLMEYARKLWGVRKLLLKAAAVGLVVGVVVALSIPRKYTVSVILSPEAGKSTSGSGLAGVASMFGLNNVNMGSDADALNITLFPEMMASTPFIIELLRTHVTTIDGDMDTTFAAYLEEERTPWWGTLMALPGMAVGGLKSLFLDEEEERENTFDPFRLTEKQSQKVEGLRKAMVADVDKKTGVTTVSVTLQDPLVTATITDTVVAKLQQYVTAYRVSKAQQDCDYLEQLYKERQAEYYEAQQNYANYIDANKSVVLQSVLTERERLQNEMSLAYQVYSQVATQLQVARAKVQEAKPVFAVVEPATVPLKPSGMGKKVMVLVFIFLSVAGTAAWILFGQDFWLTFRNGLSSEEKA